MYSYCYVYVLLLYVYVSLLLHICCILFVCCFVYCLCANVCVQLPLGLNPIAINKLYQLVGCSVVNTNTLPLYLQERFGTCCAGGWWVVRAGLCPHLGSVLGLSSPQ